MTKIDDLKKTATKLRIHSLKMTTEAKSGHPTTCLSAAELITCLFFHEMKYNINDPQDWGNDEFVLSKGHAAPILWAAYAEAGIIPANKLMSLRKINSPLEGHPTPRMKWVKAATGSLGQGLSVGVGIAAAQKLGKSPARTFVLMGDGECAEGSVWEAANSAHFFKLSNLCAVIDINRLGQSDPTMHQHDIKAYEKKLKAFGWDTFKVDGHSIEEILSAFNQAARSDKPCAILAKTLKGKGVSFLENKNGWHGKPLKEDELTAALKEIGPMPDIDCKKLVKSPQPMNRPHGDNQFNFKKNEYKNNTATRRAYGNALVELGWINDRVVVLDGDVKNSTYAEDFFNSFPERSFQVFIAEQNMIGMGIGMAIKGYLPFMATFAAFLTRAHDQIRMAAYSFSNIKIVGSHVGVSIGADGPSQMGLEDLAMFRSIPGCAVLYPSDANSAEACVEIIARYKGMAYLRTSRPATPILYDRKEKFRLGGSKVLRKSDQDAAVVIAAGITVFEALKAYDILKKENIYISVIDAYSVQPIDKENLVKTVKTSSQKAIVVEDHFESGGLGEAAAMALAGKAEIHHLAVKELPRSGEPAELLDKYGISAAHIVKTVKSLLK